MLPQRTSRVIQIGPLSIGGSQRIAVQSMTATRTQDIDATTAQVRSLLEAGADVVRVAIDSSADAEALMEIRRRVPTAVLSVDLQENYRLAEQIAPYVNKLRYNPGHLHHHEREKSTEEKVAWLAGIAEQHGLAMRVGVNCGSVAPAFLDAHPGDQLGAMVASAVAHCNILDQLGFTHYCVSLKDSDPHKVVEANTRFYALRPDVPIHLGVTEAGLPPDGIIKTRIAFEQLIVRGIGDTLRVSLTVPNPRKREEIEVGRQIIADVEAGRFRSVPPNFGQGLNIISCPSCSRVENEAFVELAEQVKELTRYAQEWKLTIAVMGCRVNGPGETDDADLGLWCGPKTVNLKRKDQSLGSFPYDQVLDHLKAELDSLIAARR